MVDEGARQWQLLTAVTAAAAAAAAVAAAARTAVRVRATAVPGARTLRSPRLWRQAHCAHVRGDDDVIASIDDRIALALKPSDDPTTQIVIGADDPTTQIVIGARVAGSSAHSSAHSAGAAGTAVNVVAENGAAGAAGAAGAQHRLPARNGTMPGERLKLLLVGETTLGEALGQALP